MRGAAKTALFLMACGALALSWREFSKGHSLPPLPREVMKFSREAGEALRPYLVSKRLRVVAPERPGERVQVWWWADLVEEAPVGKLLGELAGKAKRAGLKVAATSGEEGGEGRGEGALLLVLPGGERLAVVLRRAPVRGWFEVGLVVSPEFDSPGLLAALASLHLPLTFLLDASSPGAAKVAKWLTRQGYEVMARNARDIASLPGCFRGVLVRGRPSPGLVEIASKRGLCLLLLGWRGKVSGARAVSLDLVVRGDGEGVGPGLGRLLSLARRRGRALGLVVLSREGVGPLIGALTKWASKGVVMRTAGEMATQGDEAGR